MNCKYIKNYTIILIIYTTHKVLHKVLHKVRNKMSSTESSPLAKTEQCRICLEDEQPSNMIYPCLCSGTNKYVHDNCLKNWIILTDNREFKKKCPTCHYTYKMSRQDINDNAIKCNELYTYLSKNFWKPLIGHQTGFIFITLILNIIDINCETNYENGYIYLPIYNTTKPIINDITYFKTEPFFIYYSLSCFIYIIIWVIIIITNILLLRKTTILYIRKMKPIIIFLSPFFLITAIFMNIISMIIGTFIVTRLIQLWMLHHLYTIQLIKSVSEFKINNYIHDTEV